MQWQRFCEINSDSGIKSFQRFTPQSQLKTRRHSESAYIRQVLETGLRAHRHAHRHTKVKTVYPPVSLGSLGRYN